MATAFRSDTVLSMPLAALDRASGKVTVETKGGKVMQGRIDPKAMVHVRRYLQLRARIETDCPARLLPRRTARRIRATAKSVRRGAVSVGEWPRPCADLPRRVQDLET